VPLVIPRRILAPATLSKDLASSPTSVPRRSFYVVSNQVSENIYYQVVTGNNAAETVPDASAHNK
jgi:hypothetical protein